MRKKNYVRILCLVLVILLCVGCENNSSLETSQQSNADTVSTTSTFEAENTDPTTEPSTTEPSTTEPPTTEPSTTEPSTIEPPTTEPPTTEPPTTEPSETEPNNWYETPEEEV